MMLKKIILAVLIIGVTNLYSQIKIDSLLKRHVSILCSDSLIGRTLESGNELKAANYIIKELGNMKINSPFKDNSYNHTFSIFNYLAQIGDSYIISNNDTLVVGKDISKDLYTEKLYEKEVKLKILFLGNLSEKELNQYKVRDLSNFIVIANRKISRKLHNIINKAKVHNVIFYSEKINKPSLINRYKRNLRYFKKRFFLTKSNYSINQFYISKKQALKLAQISEEDFIKFEKIKNYKKRLKKFNKKNTYINLKVSHKRKNWQTKNIIGFIPSNNDKSIVICAHYDHIKAKPGADDNASGVASLLEIARKFRIAYANGFRPKVNIVFAFWGEEEKGLFGSKYYTDINPLFPIKKIRGCINMDMVGRYAKNEADSNAIYVKCAKLYSNEFYEKLENVNKNKTKLKLDTTYNNPYVLNKSTFFLTFQKYFASDHFNFLRHGVPTLAFSSGKHKDLHKVTDTSEKLNYFRMSKVVDLVYSFVAEISMQDSEFKLNKNYKQVLDILSGVKLF